MVLDAIQPKVLLERVLHEWNSTSVALRESPRSRSPQMDGYFSPQLLS